MGNRTLALIGVALLTTTLAVGSSSTALAQTRPPLEREAFQSSPSTQTTEGGQVTIAVTWLGPSDGPVFGVVMDTHAVDLDAYDLFQLAVLRTDQGQEVQPIGWDAPSGGHHREGTLTFPPDTPDGSLLIGPSTRGLELVIRDVAGVPERVFRWVL